MVNKIKAVFAAIGAIGLVMFVVSLFLWVITNYPGGTIEFFIASLFAYFGYNAYRYFLQYFKNQSDDEQQLNS